MSEDIAPLLVGTDFSESDVGRMSESSGKIMASGVRVGGDPRSDA